MGDLHAAAKANDTARIRALAADGADVNEADEEGLTPLFVAAHGACAEAVAALLALGADVHRWDVRGEPLMHWAAEEGSPEVIRLLLQAGADVNQCNRQGWTGLHEAALLARPEIAEVLLRAGAAPNTVGDERGMTPLLLVATTISFDSMPCNDVARLLIEYGANATAADAQGVTALEEAANCENWELAELLLAHGAVHTLRSAIDLGHLDAVLAFLSQGADPNATDWYGSTSLHDAIRHPDVVNALLSHGANPNARDSFGETPLHVWAAAGADGAVAEALIRAGAEPNIRNESGETPLMYPAKWGDAPGAETLLRLGADPTIKDADGRTPAKAARFNRHDDVARLIERAMPDYGLGISQPGGPGSS